MTHRPYRVIKNTSELNVERVTYLRDWLANGAPHIMTPAGPIGKFDLSIWRYIPYGMPGASTACGSVCCIGGTAEMLYGDYAMTDNEVGALLGLDTDATNELFFPTYPDRVDTVQSAYSLPPEKVANVLTHLIEHNEVDWERGHG